MHGPSQPPAIRDGTREDQNPLGELSKESRFQVPTTEPKSAAGTPTTENRRAAGVVHAQHRMRDKPAQPTAAANAQRALPATARWPTKDKKRKQAKTPVAAPSSTLNIQKGKHRDQPRASA